MSSAILGPLFYRYLENDKVTSFRLNKGNFDALAKISPEGKQELEWWLENSDSIENLLSCPQLIFDIFVIRLHIFGVKILTHTRI